MEHEATEHMEPWLLDLEVFCADIGSIAGNKFAWGRRHPAGEEEETYTTTDIEHLTRAVVVPLQQGRAVALGLEMPLVVPVPVDESLLGKARPCDKDRTCWSASVGASVMATGIVQLAWMLKRIREACPDAGLHVDWASFSAARSGLLIWEAFVNGPDKDPGKSHEQDALIGMRAFCAQLPEPGDPRASDIERPLCLASAAALWAGWPLDSAALRTACVVVRP